MKTLILNFGLGSHKGVLASEHPKCMTEISSKDTIKADYRCGHNWCGYDYRII